MQWARASRDIKEVVNMLSTLKTILLQLTYFCYLTILRNSNADTVQIRPYLGLSLLPFLFQEHTLITGDVANGNMTAEAIEVSSTSCQSIFQILFSEI